MSGNRKFVERDQLTTLVRAIFGTARTLVTVTRLRGGSKKGVYRLSFDDKSTVILYVWDAEENYWPAAQKSADAEQANLFSDASGSDLFAASYDCLKEIGVRTPQVYLLDRKQSFYPADIAVVEDVHGGTLEAMLEHNPQNAEPTLSRLKATLQIMRQHRNKQPGKVARAALGNLQDNQTCKQIVLARALQHLTEAASRVERIALVHKQLEEKLYHLADRVLPRDDFSLIHGELGPDHVLVDQQGDPVLIDIEGLMFFDVEWEHVFLHLRFNEYYSRLQTHDLDEQRLRFYALAMYLSLVAGPLRLLDGDFPDRAFMMDIVESNLQRTLATLHWTT